MLNRLLRSIKVRKVYAGKSEMTSGNKYYVFISHGGHWCKIIFNDNFKNDSTKKDILWCLYLDAQAYDNASDYMQFAYEYGYKDWSEAQKVFKELKKQSERLHRLFTDAEIEMLSNIY